MQTGKGTTALEQLRAAATDSWKVLFSVSGTQNFLTSTDPIPATGVISRVARQAAGRSAVARLVEKMFGGDPALLVSHLVSDHPLSADELRTLVHLLP